MKEALDHFARNIANVREHDSLYKILRERITPALDLSDILRAEIVMAVSALDHYVHELVELGIV